MILKLLLTQIFDWFRLGITYLIDILLSLLNYTVPLNRLFSLSFFRRLINLNLDRIIYILRHRYAFLLDLVGLIVHILSHRHSGSLRLHPGRCAIWCWRSLLFFLFLAFLVVFGLSKGLNVLCLWTHQGRAPVRSTYLRVSLLIHLSLRNFRLPFLRL